MAPTTQRRINLKRGHEFEIDIQRINDECNGRKRKKQLFHNSIVVPSNSSTPKSSESTLSPIPQQIQRQNKELETNYLKSIGPYRIIDQSIDESSFIALDTRNNNQNVICRRLDKIKYDHIMQLANRLMDYDDEEMRRSYEMVFPSGSELIIGNDGHYYYFQPKHYGSLHSFVVERKRLTESECLIYFRQILNLVIFCHRRRVILRDLKLRKFVFVDDDRMNIRLDGLDELYLCSLDGDDQISDRHGCPAYVGPEILDLKQKYYSGRSADIWSLGVLLYVIFYGRYPFYDTTPTRLFNKIRHANIQMEESNTNFDIRTLIRCLLRRDPSERPTAIEILSHPWLQSKDRINYNKRLCATLVNTITGQIRLSTLQKNPDNDQCVPCLDDSKLSTKPTIVRGERSITNISSSTTVPN